MNRLDQALPGSPRPRLVKETRRWLATFAGAKPKRDQWLQTWEWARNIALSYSKPMWPMASEIATQYLVLLLGEMRRSSALRLPYRASKPDLVPAAIRVLVGNGQLALPVPEAEVD